MLPLNIDEICPEHITALVDEKAAERRTLEYKEKLPEGSEGAKKEFLADICSFANAWDGDMIFGVKDQRDSDGHATGIPEAIVGLGTANPSTERDRLEALIRDGIKPRIPTVQARHFEIPGNGIVLLIRIGKSWVKPHMVALGGRSRFYSRHSTGKYQLDVQEIGQAFAEQRSIGEQLRNWRADRIARIQSDDGPIRLGGPARLLLHFVPASGLVGLQASGHWQVPTGMSNALRPTSLSPTTGRYNSDGFLVYNADNKDCASYVQVFRSGSIEYADGYVLNAGKRGGRPGEIPSKTFESKLIGAFGNALLALRTLAIEDPVYFSCTLIGIQGFTLLPIELALEYGKVRHKFDRDVVQSPDFQIDRSEPSPYHNSLLPIVDSIWQANGYEGTPWLTEWGLDQNRKPLSRK